MRRPPSGVSRSASHRRTALAVGALAVAGAAAALWLVLRHESSARISSAVSLVVSSEASLAVVERSGGRPRPIGARQPFFLISRPRVSPDGGSIAFGAQRCGTCEPVLAVVPRGGGASRRLFTSASQPDWSPDGRTIAFIYSTPNGNRQGLLIYVIGRDGRDARKVEVEPEPEAEQEEGPPYYQHPTFSPNGRLLAFAAETEPNEIHQIFLLERGTGRVEQLTKGPKEAVEPAFSPDGRVLAYACQTSAGTHDICLVGVNGRGKRVIARTAGDDREPVFSPAGTTIVFESDVAARRRAFRSLYAAALDGGRPRRLTSGFDASQPTFTPDGREVIFVRRAIVRVAPPAR